MIFKRQQKKLYILADMLLQNLQNHCKKKSYPTWMIVPLINLGGTKLNLQIKRQ